MLYKLSNIAGIKRRRSLKGFERFLNTLIFASEIEWEWRFMAVSIICCYY